jgi:phage terminase small subunit
MAKLTFKQRAFIEYYLTSWNAAEAARLAGYSEKSARVIGPENLTKPAVRSEIDRRLQAMSMSADEVLVRLSQQASSTMADFIDVEWGIPKINLKKAAAAGKLHLLKKVSYDKEGRLSGIELHDSQSALIQLGRYHKLFTDRVAVVDWRKEAEEAGINVAELYQQLVDELAVQAASVGRGDDGGGDS